MKKFIMEITIPLYVREIIESHSVRPKFYIKEELKKPLPLIFCDKAVYKKQNKRVLNFAYDWKEFTVVRNRQRKVLNFLVDVETHEKIISNSRKAGFQKTKVINGQDLHRLTLPDYLAAKIKRAIKEQMIKEVEKFSVIETFPLIIEAELFDTIDDVLNKNNTDWDVDNRFLFYGKVFCDVLSGTPMQDEETGRIVKSSKALIPDDNRKYITGPPQVTFTPIKDSNERKIVFRIYEDCRPVIMCYFNKYEFNNQIELCL